jgi:hypothetical protein
MQKKIKVCFAIPKDRVEEIKINFSFPTNTTKRIINILYYPELIEIGFDRIETEYKNCSLKLDQFYDRTDIFILTATITCEKVLQMLLKLNLNITKSKVEQFIELNKKAKEKFGDEIDKLRQELGVPWGTIELMLKDEEKTQWIPSLTEVLEMHKGNGLELIKKNVGF